MPLLAGISLNYAFFRHHRKFTQFLAVGGGWMITHLMIKAKIEDRYHRLVDPYFTKYEIK